MKLLVVAATQAELSKVYEYFNFPIENFIQTPQFDVIITGVGMTATAFTLGKHLNHNYDLILNVGIAGSFDQNIPLGNLVNVVEDTFSELGAEDNDHFITINELGFGNNSFSSTFEFNDLPNVSAITVNKVHGHSASIASVQQQFKPDIESMEGAAVFFACHAMNISCLQIRAISNYVEPRAKENWQIGLAIKNLNEWLIDFIEKLTK